MIENTPMRSMWDLRSQLNIVHAVLVAVQKELGDEAYLAEVRLVDRLLEKARAAGLDARELQKAHAQLRSVMPPERES